MKNKSINNKRKPVRIQVGAQGMTLNQQPDYSHITQNKGTQMADAGLGAASTAFPVAGAFAAVGKGAAGIVSPTRADGTQSTNGLNGIFNPSEVHGYLAGEGELKAWDVINPIGGAKKAAEMKNQKIRNEQYQQGVQASHQQGVQAYGGMAQYGARLYAGGGELNGDPKKPQQGTATPAPAGAPTPPPVTMQQPMNDPGTATTQYLYRNGLTNKEGIQNGGMAPAQQHTWDHIQVPNPMNPTQKIPYGQLYEQYKQPGTAEQWMQKYPQQFKSRADIEAWMNAQYQQDRQGRVKAGYAPDQRPVNQFTGQMEDYSYTTSGQQHVFLKKGGEIPSSGAGVPDKGAVVLQGKSHEQGGNPVVDEQGQKVAETEAGELLLDAQQSQQVKALAQRWAQKDQSALMELGKLMKQTLLKRKQK